MGRGSRGGGAVLSIILAGVTLGLFLGVRKLTEFLPAPDSNSISTGADSASDEPPTLPVLDGMEAVKVFDLGSYRAALYRYATPPLVFTQGKFVVYDQRYRAMYETDTLEGTREPWTRLYDFAARGGRGERPVYLQDLNGDGAPEIVLGQFSGGGFCCTTVTVLTLHPSGVEMIGMVENIAGVPLENVHVRDVDRDGVRELLVEVALPPLCGSPRNAPHQPVAYTFPDGEAVEGKAQSDLNYRQILALRRSLWRRRANRTLHLLLNISVNYALLGDQEDAMDFFDREIGLVKGELEAVGVGQDACREELKDFLKLMGPKPS